MNFLIITHVPHVKKDSKLYGYAPYIWEMNIWLKYVEKGTIVAPIDNTSVNNIHLEYQHLNLEFKEVPKFDIINIISVFKTLLKLPKLLYIIFVAMQQADHIHLRCPGNMGLIGCFMQIFFPSKIKTAKYAGNWDPKSNQPWSYKIQKWILNNTFLTKNMTVLVYGEWSNQSKNIKPFFTATYTNEKRELILPRSLKNKIIFTFVGTLSVGKRPLYAVKIIEKLSLLGYDVKLDIYGDGLLMNDILEYIHESELTDIVVLHGNQNKENIENAYKNCNFLILPSKSEGWPKVVAEAMFWGALPLVTDVSCVNYMINNGERGKVLSLHLDKDIQNLVELISKEDDYMKMCLNARNWSQKYTIDCFESEIKKIV